MREKKSGIGYKNLKTPLNEKKNKPLPLPGRNYLRTSVKGGGESVNDGATVEA